MIDSKVTGIAKAARKMPITVSLQSQETNEEERPREIALGLREDLPALLACSQSFWTWRQKILATITIRKAPPRTIDDRRHRVVRDVAKVLGEGTGHGEEEVEVDEGAGDREEDLLHEVGRHRARKRGAR